MQKRTICLIEDDPLVREALTFALKDGGFIVVSAANGPSGLALAATMAPDIVLTDYNLPGRDGAALISELRASAPERPIIAMTGGPTGVDLAIKAGADICLTKPFRPRELIALIDQLTMQPRRAEGA